MTTPDCEIHQRIAALTPAQKRRVLDYLRAPSEAPRVKPGEEWHRDLSGISEETACALRSELTADRRVTGTPGRDLLRFAGIWTDEEADEMTRVIEDAFERVEPDVR
jgi:nucleotide-binding universal stress UspA family protein